MKWYRRTVPEQTVPTLEEVRAYVELDTWFSLYRRGILTLEQALLCGLVEALEQKRTTEYELGRYRARFGNIEPEELGGEE